MNRRGFVLSPITRDAGVFCSLFQFTVPSGWRGCNAICLPVRMLMLCKEILEMHRSRIYLTASLHQWPNVPPPDNDECGAVEMNGRVNWSTQIKHAAVPFYPPQIPYDLTRTRTRLAVVGTWRLNSLVTANCLVYRPLVVTSFNSMCFACYVSFSAYMAIFRCVGYFYFHMPEGFCLAAFGSLPFFHVVTHCMFSICVLFLCCFPSLFCCLSVLCSFKSGVHSFLFSICYVSAFANHIPHLPGVWPLCISRDHKRKYIK
jgi:hypothetical protein